MKKQKLPLQSAKFRKDYMAAFAFLLFCAIVFGECMLAVGIPLHLRLEKVWTTQIAQQDMVNHFDTLRRNTRSYASKAAHPAAEEAELMCRTLDRMAPYLHRYSKQLDAAECKNLMDTFHIIGNHAYALAQRKGKAFSAEISLDTKGYLQKMRGRQNAVPATTK